ncbi:hemolysin family protein [Leucobacter sp. UCMA 4100]|uniref:hemolysin family protein n=1 Tax=Leucobacter sp. UCMA 4100 TaxID=2810534 RepID=UPI0022EAEF97|nr:hemolysin family protein [Leucobacter sp. UCMA 4100]
MIPGLVIGLAALAVLVTAAGGLLAAIDAAYTALSKSDLEELAEENPAKADRLELIGDNLERHLRNLSFMRITAETFSAVLITLAYGEIWESVWVTLAAAALTIVVLNIIVISVSPRQLGERHPERIVRGTVGLVRMLDTLLTPLAPVMSGISERAFSARSTQAERLKNEQIFSLVDRAAEQELLEEDEQDIIHSVVEFSDTLVKEVMVPRTDMITIESTVTVQEALDFFMSSPYSRIPVISGDSDGVIGVMYLRDVVSFVHRRTEEAQHSQVTRVMKPARFVPDLQRTDDLLREMQREANHLAIAVDEYGGIAGLVTLEDLIEELVGEIHDEHDKETPDIVMQPDGSYHINARLDIDELGELFDEELDDDDVETVAGLVAKELGRLAEPGDVVRISGIELTVLNVEKKRQRLVSVRAKWVGRETQDMMEVPENKEEHDD